MSSAEEQSNKGEASPESGQRRRVVWSWPRLLLTLVLLTAVGFFAFNGGRAWQGVDKTYLAGLEAQRDALAAERQALNTQLVNVRLQHSVTSQAGQVLQQDLRKLRDDREALKNELAFYRSLMAPGKLVKGLQVANLELFPRGEGKFTFHLVLTQVTNQRSRVSGVVSVEIGGTTEQETQPQVFSLTDLAEVDEYPLPYRFRYFQDIKGKLELPQGFRPQWVAVSATPKGKSAVERRFEWAELIQG